MVRQTLEEAVGLWRRVVAAAYPLYAETPVVLGGDPSAPAPFEAYTDGTRIFVNVHRPAEFEAEFARFAAPLYRGGSAALYHLKRDVGEPALAESLQVDLFLFVLFHELFHPMVCPDGPDDERAVSRAIYAGLKKARGDLDAKGLLYCTDHVKNLVWDVVVNVVFLARVTGAGRDALKGKQESAFLDARRRLDGQPVVWYPCGVLPLIYLISARNRRTDALISLAGMFLAGLSVEDAPTRRAAMGVFLQDLREKGVEPGESVGILTAMYASLARDLDGRSLDGKGVDKAEYLHRASLMGDFERGGYGRNRAYLIGAAAGILGDPALRYTALSSLVQVLAPFVSEWEKHGSVDQLTSGGRAGEPTGSGGDGEPEGGSSEDARGAESLARTLDDVGEDLGPDGVKDVLEKISENPAPCSSGKAPGKGHAKEGECAPSPLGSMGSLSTFAKDELLRRAAPAVDILSPRAGFSVVETGNQLRWELKSSVDLSAAELAGVDMTRIIDLQSATGLPVLVQTAGDRYKLNEYAVAETPVRGWAPRQFDLDVPDNWVLLLDSSGSMCGEPFRLLLLATYGIMGGIARVCRSQVKNPRFGVVNFSSETVYSGMWDFLSVHASRVHPVKQVLFREQGGGTELDPAVFSRVLKDLKPGRSAFTLVSDGCIDDPARAFSEVERVAATPGSAFLFIEVSAESDLGRMVADRSATLPGLSYRRVSKMGDVGEALRRVLLRYS